MLTHQLSPSSRGRGLKYIVLCDSGYLKRVALFTRAWIEISSSSVVSTSDLVALFTRAWIEMQISNCMCAVGAVALFTRAWIEIAMHCCG